MRRLPLKKESFYIERDEEKRNVFDDELANLPPDTDTVYVDECGINKHMSRGYGRAPKGKRVYLPTHGRKFKKINLIGGMLGGKIRALMKYTWNTNTEWFNEWFEWYLCPLLRRDKSILGIKKTAKIENISTMFD